MARAGRVSSGRVARRHLSSFGVGRDLRGGARTGARRTARIGPGKRVRPDPSAQPPAWTRQTQLLRAPRSRRMSERQHHNAHRLRLLEALFFAAPEPLGEDDLARHLGPDADTGGRGRELVDTYSGRGVNLVRVAGGWTFRTAPDLGPALQHERVVARRLSRAAVETLAIIAYHQPVTRAEIETIRGVALARGTLDRLIEAGWVRPAGRREAPGRPLIWATTPAFLAHFGFDSLKDLPGIDELRAAGLLDIGPASLGEAASLAAQRAETGQAEQEGGSI